MFTFIASRKIEKSANNIYREMWEKGMKVSVNRTGFYSKLVHLNCGRFQLHIKDKDLADRSRYTSFSDTDSKILRIFAVALACSNMGKYYDDFAYIANNLNLDGVNENIF